MFLWVRCRHAARAGCRMTSWNGQQRGTQLTKGVVDRPALRNRGRGVMFIDYFPATGPGLHSISLTSCFHLILNNVWKSRSRITVWIKDQREAVLDPKVVVWNMQLLMGKHTHGVQPPPTKPGHACSQTKLKIHLLFAPLCMFFPFGALTVCVAPETENVWTTQHLKKLL